MADNLTKEKRSKIMSSIKGHNTQPEMHVRRILHAAGYRYRLHVKDLPGKPDIVFRSRKKVIFIHGCFWHFHDEDDCTISHRPTSNSAFWDSKFQKNKARDALNLQRLRDSDWDVMTIWECELKDPAKLEKRLIKFLDSGKYRLYSKK